MLRALWTVGGSEIRGAAEIVRNHGLRDVPVFVEHHPPETTNGKTETFDLLVFAHEEVRQIVREEAEGMRAEFGPPTWKPLDRRTVERLLGHRV